VFDLFSRRGASFFEGVPQRVCLTVFRCQPRVQAKQLASGNLLSYLQVHVGDFDFARCAQFLAYQF